MSKVHVHGVTYAPQIKASTFECQRSHDKQLTYEATENDNSHEHHVLPLQHIHFGTSFLMEEDALP